MLVNQTIIPDIKSIINTAKEKAIRLVDNERTLMHWNIGRRIFEEEQEGKDRTDYGNYLIKYIAKQLEPEYGSGFSMQQLELFRQCYRNFPIANTLYSQLSWSQCKLFLRIENGDKKEFYIAEELKNRWTIKAKKLTKKGIEKKEIKVPGIQGILADYKIWAYKKHLPKTNGAK